MIISPPLLTRQPLELQKKNFVNNKHLLLLLRWGQEPEKRSSSLTKDQRERICSCQTALREPKKKRMNRDSIIAWWASSSVAIKQFVSSAQAAWEVSSRAGILRWSGRLRSK